MRIVSVVGARPQFVKLAPMAGAAARAGVDHLIVHTGQHYDPMMSDSFFTELGIKKPDVQFNVGSGSHGEQTGEMLKLMDAALIRLRPDWVLVYGDTNSTLAAALSAVKLQLPVAHLEAGLRSFNRTMPEEHNRILVDHAADLCLAPTDLAMRHLANEGLAERSELVGDVMTDVLLEQRDRVLAAPRRICLKLGLGRSAYYVATVHRAENTNDPVRLAELLKGLSALDRPVLLLAHPRLRALATAHHLNLEIGSIRVIDPVAYPDLIELVMNSAGVVTDSGGLQKEAFLLQVQCTTLRKETEWVETVELGWNRLANSTEQIVASVHRDASQPAVGRPYGDGQTADRVLSLLTGRKIR